jgi:hypothetical protein
LDPTINKTEWTEDEARILFNWQAVYGNHWTEIARFLPGRTDNSVKNFFYTTLKKKIRAYNRTQPTERQIFLSVNEVSLDSGLLKKVMQNGKKARREQTAV